MVSFDTVNSFVSGRPFAEAELAIWLEAVAQSMGLASRRLPIDDGSFNLLVHLAASDFGADEEWLIFESHLDTVSVEGMTIDPFGGEIQDGKLFGRGACDTKASGAAMLWALREYAAQSKRSCPIAVLFACDEEYSQRGAVAFAQYQLVELGWKTSGIVVGEPTLMMPVVAHNGVVRWTISTRGEAAHSSDPARGRSAISMMIRVVDALEARYIPALQARHLLTGKAQCSVNLIRGGSQINIIPDECHIEVDRRVVPGENPGEVIPEVERMLEELRHDYSGLEVTQGTPFLAAPLDPSNSQSFIDFVMQTLRRLGMTATPQGAAYGTDAGVFSAAGLPCVVLGPGDIAQAHTKDEWIELNQLDLATQTYLGLMRQFTASLVPA